VLYIFRNKLHDSHIHKSAAPFMIMVYEHKLAYV